MIEINKIIQGDCLEVMKEIDNKSIDMILCDLPSLLQLLSLAKILKEIGFVLSKTLDIVK